MVLGAVFPTFEYAMHVFYGVFALKGALCTRNPFQWEMREKKIKFNTIFDCDSYQIYRLWSPLHSDRMGREIVQTQIWYMWISLFFLIFYFTDGFFSLGNCLNGNLLRKWMWSRAKRMNKRNSLFSYLRSQLPMATKKYVCIRPFFALCTFESSKVLILFIFRYFAHQRYPFYWIKK